ncbi:MAG: MFS transporter [Bacteroidaceae bacterium]
MTKQQKSYVLPIIVMIALFGMISFVTGLQNPMGIIVKNQFGASNFMSQLGNAANFLAYLFMGIPSGLLLQRVGYKKTALIAVAVGFIGVGIQYLSGSFESFPVYLAGAFISGFSMCMLNAVVNPMLNTLGGGGKKGNQLIQIGGSFNSLNATIVPVLVGYLIGNASQATIKDANPALFIAMGVFAFVFVVLLIVNIPEPSLARQEENNTSVAETITAPLSYKHFALGAIAIFVYVGVEVGIPNFSNLFMTSSAAEGGLGINPTIAGSVVGTYWFLMLIGRLLGGIFGGKVSSKAMLSTTSGLAALLVVLAIFSSTDTLVKMPVFMSDISLGLAEVPITFMFLTLCGFCTSIMWGSIFNLAVEGLGKHTEAASGIFMMLVVGGGIFPLIQGGIADSISYTASFWLVFAGLIYLLYYALIGSKVTKRADN